MEEEIGKFSTKSMIFNFDVDYDYDFPLLDDP